MPTSSVVSGCEFLTVAECTVFYSFLRLRCLVPKAAGRLDSTKLLRRDGFGEAAGEVRQVAAPGGDQGPHRVFEIHALIDRAAFPDAYALRLNFELVSHVIPAAQIVALEETLHARSSLAAFRDIAARETQIAHGGRPRLLDLGGRPRSGTSHGRGFADCDVTVLDIRPDPGVDVVGDIHAMSGILARESFDLIVCVSVFEHLLMPWKAVLEMNHVLRPGGLVFVQTHQTIGMHDIPWDYYRFSDTAWDGLFNHATGFAVRKRMMNQFVHVVPQHYCASAQGSESAGGFLESAVIAQKIGSTGLSWPVEIGELVTTTYPD